MQPSASHTRLYGYPQLITLPDLALRLYNRRTEAVVVKRVHIGGGAWQPDPNQCHRNVTQWCEWHPEQKAVRGWLVADYLEIPPSFYRFFAHSVIETVAGDLIDLTPNLAPWQYPFLRHDQADGDFADIVEGGKVISVSYWVD